MKGPRVIFAAMIGIALCACGKFSNDPSFALGEMGPSLPTEASFKIDVKNYHPHPWRLSLSSGSSEIEAYKKVHVSVKVLNKGPQPIVVWQAILPRDHKTATIRPGEKIEVFSDSLAAFCGFLLEKSYSNMNIWAEKGDRLQMDLVIGLTGKPLDQPLRVGLSHTEPRL